MNLLGFFQTWWRSYPDHVRRLLVLFAIVLVGAYFFEESFFKQPKDDTNASGGQQLSSTYPYSTAAGAYSAGQSPSSQTPGPPLPTPEEIAVAKSRWTDVKSQIDDIRSQIDDTSRDMDFWSRLTKDLLASEAGRRIAASQPSVDQYRALIESERPTSSQLDALRDALEIHFKVAQGYLGQTQNTSSPGPATSEELSRIAADLETIAYRYRTDRRALESLVAETASVPPAEQSLQVALEQRGHELSRQYREQLTAALAEAQAEGQRAIEEAEAKAIKAKKEAEAERIDQLGQAEAEKMREDTARRLADLEREEQRLEAERLRAVAEDPEVQKKYSAFLAEGTFQFTAPPNGMCNRVTRPMPVSFGELSGNQWLTNSETFARAMSRYPCITQIIYNERPTREYPKTTEEWGEADRLLQQFKVLGPIWVEMKLLRP